MRILITGGAGFVGAALAEGLKRTDPSSEVWALDNLRRRGSELNVASFRTSGVTFAHGDIRCPSDLEDLPGHFDVLIEASAEPSVLAGLDGAPTYVLQTNLLGTLNCLEFARRRCGAFVFLSTSRVYSIASLRDVRLDEAATRFEIAEGQVQRGVSRAGIAEGFETTLPRSLYGATKLASELIIQEYADTYGMHAVINRCGVIAGPGQFGKVDQGVFTLWVANHHFGKPLRYTGFGGQGKQVRDLLHPADLLALVRAQIEALPRHSGEVFNIGGGREVSTSLAELTALCRQVVGREVPVASHPDSPAVDIPLYISDSARARAAYGWAPTRSVQSIVEDIHRWMCANEGALRPIFGA